MRLAIRKPYPEDWTREVELPDGWPVPRTGESVELAEGSFTVHDVVHWPEGEDGSGPMLMLILE